MKRYNIFSGIDLIHRDHLPELSASIVAETILNMENKLLFIILLGIRLFSYIHRFLGIGGPSSDFHCATTSIFLFQVNIYEHDKSL